MQKFNRENFNISRKFNKKNKGKQPEGAYTDQSDTKQMHCANVIKIMVK